MKKGDRKGLGRGLSALLAEVGDVPESSEPRSGRTPDTLSLDKLFPNPDQPRRHFAQEALEDLASSIREKGIIQPLVVRPDPKREGMYQIVAGERRWRAAQKAQLHEVPILVRDFTDTETLEVAIIENIQRADLNPVEEALGYRQLLERFGHTQEQLASALGKSRPHIANLLRLLNLPVEVLDLLRDGKISAGHARALLTSRDPKGLARRVVAEGLSVRQVEAMAKEADAPTTQSKPKGDTRDADTRALEADLSAHLGLRVVIDHKLGQEAGELRLKYRDLEQLDQICQKLTD
ncbi:MAG: ParB/RepB/Spo0J family partition protein [Pseudomonadota bacterium]